MRVPVSWPVQVTNSNFIAEEVEGWFEDVVYVGEEEVRTTKDKVARVFRSGEEVGSEEGEDGGEGGWGYGGCEEVGRVVDEPGDVGLGEGVGFKECDDGEDVVDGVQVRKVVWFCVGVYYG